MPYDTRTENAGEEESKRRVELIMIQNPG